MNRDTVTRDTATRDGLALARTRPELARLRAAMPGRVGVVMTMGALHEGHLSLVDRARSAADHVIVTVFVNPLQFGPGEDFDRYPRDLDADMALLADRHVDAVFAPAADAVYPGGRPQVTVSAGDTGRVLEGQARPGHFDGVLTVVSLLLHLTRPHVAVFGRKDAQQLALIRRMVVDLGLDEAFGTKIVSGDIVREPDGLAMSSRNAYLSPQERRHALALSAALRAAQGAAAAGAVAPAAAAAAQSVLDGADGVEPDYAVAVDPATFRPADERFTGEALVLVAARVGRTRLIDNAPVLVPARQPA